MLNNLSQKPERQFACVVAYRCALCRCCEWTHILSTPTVSLLVTTNADSNSRLALTCIYSSEQLNRSAEESTAKCVEMS